MNIYGNQIIAAGHRMLRKWRSYFIPSHVRSYKEVVRNGLWQSGDDGRQAVVFDFTQPNIDFDAGRYAFGLVREFERLGDLVVYRANFQFLATMHYKNCKELLLKRPFRVVQDIDALSNVVAIVTDRPRAFSNSNGRVLRVSYEARMPACDREISIPYQVHPGLYDAQRVGVPIDLKAERPWRLFFAGATNYRYNRATLRTAYGKLSRVTILEHLQSTLAAEKWHRILSDHDLETSARGQIVLLDSNAWRIPQDQWFRTLEKADFFLACPGVAMPLCHNIIEAMAMGTIPILEYPEYFDPPLRDGVNCMVFRGPEGLIRTVERVLQLNSAEVQRLREGAQTHYAEHLAQGLVARRVASSPYREVTLLLNACMAPR